MTISKLFRQHFDTPPDVCVRAPGRVNLIGEHIDYNGGHVMPLALERSVSLAAKLRSDGRYRLYSAQMNRVLDLHLPDAKKGNWADYVFGVVYEFRKLGYAVDGLDIALDSTVPRGSGLSSSAALEVAVAWALQQLLGSNLSRMEIALLGQRAENRFVGVNCGIMDQAASACCTAGHVLLLDCGGLEYEQVPVAFGDRAVILVAHSGVQRGLSSSAYNERRSQCDRALDFVRKETGLSYSSLCSVSADSLDQIGSRMEPVVFRRARHAISEETRVREAAKALEAGDLARIGALLNASHASLQGDYEVSSGELDELTSLIRSQEGSYGSRLTGAGFGGCTISLVERDAADDIMAALKKDYYNRKGFDPVMFITEAMPGASTLD